MRLRLPLIVALSALLSGCATLSAPACPAGQTAMTTAQLVFGRNIDGKPGVTDAQFQAYVDEELTPRFPDGLTVVEASGQWRGASGLVEREGSKVVLLVLPKGGGADAKIEAARKAYMARFKQEAVLLISQPACVAF